MLGTTTNGELETYRRQDNVFVCVQDTAFTVWSAASVSESESQPTERLYDVLPNQQGHQVLYRITCYVGCGNLPDFPLQYCTLSRWRYGEALRQDFLYTTKLESKFILRPTGMPPPQISSLKPVFRRGKYEYYIQFTARRGTVSGVTLKQSLLFPSVCQM